MLNQQCIKCNYNQQIRHFSLTKHKSYDKDLFLS